MQPTRGIDYNKILQLPACFLDAKLCRLHRVRLSALKHRNPYLGANDLQLVYCRGAIYIARHKHGRLAVLLGKITCKFARHSGLTRALKTRKQYHAGAFGTELYFGTRSAHKRGKLFIYYFYHLLGRCKAFQHL